jgi:hypothetical protein
MSATALRALYARGKTPLDGPPLAEAAIAVAEMRRRWGWTFREREGEVMAIDLLLAETAIRTWEAENPEPGSIRRHLTSLRLATRAGEQP